MKCKNCYARIPCSLDFCSKECLDEFKFKNPIAPLRVHRGKHSNSLYNFIRKFKPSEARPA